LFEEAGLYTEAYGSYRDAIQSMPLNNDAYARTIWLLTKSYAGEANPQSREKLLIAIRSYLTELKGRPHADAELYLTQGLGYNALAPGREACQYMANAIRLHPASAQYVFETAGCYARHGERDEALATIRRIEPYLEKFRTSGNPQGLFVYKIRDLEADIEYGNGNLEKALALGRENLLSGESGQYAILSSKAREFLPKEVLIQYLVRKVKFYEGAMRRSRQTGPRASGV